MSHLYKFPLAGGAALATTTAPSGTTPVKDPHGCITSKGQWWDRIDRICRDPLPSKKLPLVMARRAMTSTTKPKPKPKPTLDADAMRRGIRTQPGRSWPPKGSVPTAEERRLEREKRALEADAAAKATAAKKAAEDAAAATTREAAAAAEAEAARLKAEADTAAQAAAAAQQSSGGGGGGVAYDYPARVAETQAASAELEMIEEQAPATPAAKGSGNTIILVAGAALVAYLVFKK